MASRNFMGRFCLFFRSPVPALLPLSAPIGQNLFFTLGSYAPLQANLNQGEQLWI